MPSNSSALADRTGVRSGPLGRIAGIDLDYAGYGIVGLFVLTWVVSVLVWRVGRFEQRWSAGPMHDPEESAVTRW
ncbi:hypothetical protein [Speluncibacter jeojiensis]|uniref:Uncharacterized protein n=1 Tax=Speluncibacter jeojiensis TaxID=2710754 RepID=A0A9X4M1G9_9ACTN|nr:hypothetical protein [Corynebacteriales bacterium D3-21]